LHLDTPVFYSSSREATAICKNNIKKAEVRFSSGGLYEVGKKNAA